ncbi:type II toxin-antitoxin system RelE/ParE family toxin [Ekhidna sp. MALMAid0563]|uniref:type II toxin-antitoxin system RelE/ParE family toxin n=1 Tax=Ekhidna sp. MALMAid0563 TaxID=3143937 RepID=UPI0032DF9576
MAKYRISNIAKADLIRIHQYGTSTYGMDQADRYFNAFFDKFELISERPFAFESVDFIKEGYRKCVCGVDTIFYRINNEVVEIMTIIGRQDRLENLHNLD